MHWTMQAFGAASKKVRTSGIAELHLPQQRNVAVVGTSEYWIRYNQFNNLENLWLNMSFRSIAEARKWCTLQSM